jgi:hypothetical protein
MDAALSAFGLLHGTPLPPPTWAHGRKITIPSMSQVSMTKQADFAGDYARHTALNAGQTMRDVREFFNHPAASDSATPGTWKHKLVSAFHSAPDLAKDIIFSVLPPQLHHSEKELAGLRGKSLPELFQLGNS